MTSSVEEIKAKLNIVDVVGEYVRLQKAGVSWRANCPFHHEKSPSFMVNEEKQIWHCFGCNKGGDIFGFVMESEGMEFKEALKLLADKAGVQLQSFKRQEMGGKQNRVPEILELSTKFFEKQLWDGIGKNKMLPYLRGRGLSDESIKNFRLGFAPQGWRNLLTFLTGRGYTAEEIMKAGLIIRKEQSAPAGFYDRFRERIIFPIQDNLGRVVGFTARVAPGGDESQAKYVNSPETEAYQKSKVLYGLDKAKREIKNQNFVLVVEGNMDVIACHQAGLVNTVAVSGTALTEEQLKALKRYTQNVKLFFDMDSAGVAATRRSAELCFLEDMNVNIVVLPEGKDAADAARENPDRLRQAVKEAVSAMDYFFTSAFTKYNKQSGTEKKAIAAELVDILAQLANPIERAHWVKKLAEALEVEEKIIADVVIGAIKKKRTPGVAPKGEEDQLATQAKRSDVLKNQLAGAMLANPAVWKYISQGEEIDELLLYSITQHIELKTLLERGREVDFNIDRLVGDISDDKLRQRIQDIHFRTRYQFDSQGNIVERTDISEESAKQNLREIEIELVKERMDEVERRIREREQAGDKAGAQALTREFGELMKKLQSIVK